MPREVRKRSLFSKLKNAPADFLLKVWEDYETVEWETVQTAVSWPLALSLNGLCVLLRLVSYFDTETDQIFNANGEPIDMSSKEKEQWFDLYKMVVEWLPRSFSSWVRAVEHLLLFVSVLNCFYLFTKTRRYHLFNAVPDVHPRSRNVRKVAFDDKLPSWSESFPGRIVFPLYQLFQRVNESEARTIWELNVWDPPVFAVNLFCWFSPMQVMIIHQMNSSNWLYTMVTAGVCMVMNTYLVHSYKNLVKDKEVLFGQVYNEYNLKLVHPKIFIRREERELEIHHDEEMDSPNQSFIPRAVSEFFSPSRPRRSDAVPELESTSSPGGRYSHSHTYMKSRLSRYSTFDDDEMDEVLEDEEDEQRYRLDNDGDKEVEEEVLDDDENEREPRDIGEVVAEDEKYVRSHLLQCLRHICFLNM
ncbi:hypothetical protein BKA69DRAFT_1086684 [Paraphysoderma sedebokerense]|nr:hypothetical protein BKA69DRAFT_1086684 [Paraphysoderma sedebokerense]